MRELGIVTEKSEGYTVKNASAKMDGSAAADEMHHFYVSTGFHRCAGPIRFADDGPIEFDGDPVRYNTDMLEQTQHRQSRRDRAQVSV